MFVMVCLNHINGFKSLDGMFAVFHIYIQCHPMSPLAPYHLLCPTSRMAFMTISLFPRSSSGAYFNLPLREIPIQALNAWPSTTGRRFRAAGGLHVQMKFLQPLKLVPSGKQTKNYGKSPL